MLLATGAMAWSGGLWAGYSTSLNSHLAARAFQGLGAGAVEALVSIRKRNCALSLGSRLCATTSFAATHPPKIAVVF